MQRMRKLEKDIKHHALPLSTSSLETKALRDPQAGLVASQPQQSSCLRSYAAGVTGRQMCNRLTLVLGI